MRTENRSNVIIGSGEGGRVLDPDVAAERNWCGDGR